METNKYYLNIEYIEDTFLDLTKEQIDSLESIIETCKKSNNILPLFQIISDFSKYSNKEINYQYIDIDGSNIEISPLSIEEPFIDTTFVDDEENEEEIEEELQGEIENEEDD